MLSRLFLPAVVLILSFSTFAVAQESAKAKQEDSQMEKEHAAATLEHLNWQTKIMKRKAEHRSALAALASLQADLLKHEAELEMMSLKIMTHQNEMAAHDHAISEHEEHGKGGQHNELKKEHAEFMGDHKKMKKEIDASTSHHKELIDGIMQLIKKHKSEFNEREMGDSGGTRKSNNTGSIDSLKSELTKLKKTLEFEKVSRAQQLSNLQSMSVRTQAKLKEKTRQYNEEQKKSQTIVRELKEVNRRLAEQDAELAKLKLKVK